MSDKPCGTKADGTKYFVMNRGGRAYHRFLKKQKNRLERHRAKTDPECIPTYGLYNGYES